MISSSDKISMTQIFVSDHVELHSKNCRCRKCTFEENTSNFAYTSMLVPRNLWESIGQPQNLEDYYSKVNDTLNIQTFDDR